MEWATDQGSPERLNEDFVAAAAGAVVVLDGCGLPLGTDLGCVHGTAWYARSLGTRLLARMLDGAGPPAGSPVGPPEGAHRPGTRPLVARLARRDRGRGRRPPAELRSARPHDTGGDRAGAAAARRAGGLPGAGRLDRPAGGRGRGAGDHRRHLLRRGRSRRRRAPRSPAPSRRPSCAARSC
ncbi:hypothetical protein [Actinomadura madurae]|uniref:hypothetical protein n=1 Tax=Actinomadura madurae TaxID=1993 RepID=UPI0020D21195|nr:hypothetical protein [Actinomadura madurae]MCQ0019934.1 hypothetical protein [Actinomadura madurae]